MGQAIVCHGIAGVRQPSGQGGKDMIAIKPHHFVDILTSFGAGSVEFEPHPYGHAVHVVARRILEDREALLRIELGADDICAPCRHNLDGLCDDTIDTSYRPDAPPLKRDWNLLIDRRWCERLEIGHGDRLSARELCLRLRDRAGDITDLYREIPADRTADRAANLRVGIARFLQISPTRTAGPLSCTSS
jgi:hypothetical protein